MSYFKVLFSKKELSQLHSTAQIYILSAHLFVLIHWERSIFGMLESTK